MPDRAIGQHLVRWVGRGRGKGRPSGNMTPKTKVSTGGQWALGAMTSPLLLPFSSNSFFEVSPTPKDDVNRRPSLLGVSRQHGGPCHLQGVSSGVRAGAAKPGLWEPGCLWPRNDQPHRTPRFRTKEELDIFLVECPSHPLAWAVGTSVSGNHQALGTEPDSGPKIVALILDQHPLAQVHISISPSSCPYILPNPRSPLCRQDHLRRLGHSGQDRVETRSQTF